MDNLWICKNLVPHITHTPVPQKIPLPCAFASRDFQPEDGIVPYVFFLTLNEDVNGQSNCWIQAGLTLDSLRTFFGYYVCRFRDSGYSWTGELPVDLTNSSGRVVFVGTARASETGEISVYVKNRTNSVTRYTDYLGVGYEEAPSEDPPYPTTPAFHVAVWVHGGSYQQEETFVLYERDSWTIYRVLSNMSVRLVGGVEYTATLTRVTDPLVIGREAWAEARVGVRREIRQCSDER
jgi:hypothetical protein